MFKLIMPALLAVGLVAVGPMSEAFGQKGGGGGGGRGGGGGGGGGAGRGAPAGARAAPAGARVGGAGGYSGMAHPGGPHPGGQHPGGYHPGYPYYRSPFFYGGIYLGNPFWYNYGPGYIDSGYGYGYGNGYDNGPIITTRPMTTLPQETPPPTEGSAQIDVVLPRADAKVWIDGNPMAAGSGTQRSFVSPPLEPGFSYSYRVTASWMTPDGQEVRVERMVPVAPGRQSIMDFTKINTKQTMPPAQD